MHVKGFRLHFYLAPLSSVLLDRNPITPSLASACVRQAPLGRSRQFLLQRCYEVSLSPLFCFSGPLKFLENRRSVRAGPPEAAPSTPTSPPFPPSALCSAAQQLLQSARPLVVPQSRQCAHQQSRPTPLRRLASSDTDPVVELLVASSAEQDGAPCCILPAARFYRGPQVRAWLGVGEEQRR